MQTGGGRIMGLDIGDVRIGVAMSDPMRIIASAHSVVQRRSLQEDIVALKQLADEQDVSTIVAGMPLNQYGQPGPQAEKVAAFIQQFQAHTGLEIETVDERFSTAYAERNLIAAGAKRKRRKQVIDKLAAQEILRAYMDRRGQHKSGGEHISS